MKHSWLLLCLFLLCIVYGTEKKQIHAEHPQGLVPFSPEQDSAVLASHFTSLKKKYQNSFLMRGPETKREVALTFDDAPDDVFTPKILDILNEKGVKATFFLVGFRVEKYPETAKRIVEEGHAIGNHSYNHPDFLTLTDQDFRNQITATDSIIRSFTGQTPKIVRPPYGNIGETQMEWLAANRKMVVNWDVDSLDWKGIDAQEVTGNILPNVNPGSIVLQHSGTGEGGDLTGTVNALPVIIDELRKKGYNLVTVHELLDLQETGMNKKK